MANIGDETTASSSTSIENFVRGIPATMPEAGSITSVTAYIGETNASNAHTCKAIIFDGSGNVLGESTARNDIPVGAPAWVEFTFSTPVSVGAVDIIIAAFAGAGAGALELGYDTGTTGDGVEAANVSYPTVADPTTFTDNAHQYSIYATYTPGGDPEGSLIQGKLLRGGLLLGGVLTR